MSPDEVNFDDDDGEEYSDSFSSRFIIQPFNTWKEFAEYRKLLIFRDVHPFIVNTDITNFFDSVLHSQVQKTLSDIPVPRVVIELLLLLLERLSPKAPLAPCAAIGLPVEEFGCSRALAHIVLFPHDLRMVAAVGEENYVRWMDDQNFGAKSLAQALRLIGEIQRSLTLLHLTPNSGKTKILSIEKAVAHFHVACNVRLNELEKMPSDTADSRRSLRLELVLLWRNARKTEDVGEFAKVLKRVYRIAALCDCKLLVPRVRRDILRFPEHAGRIAEYARCVMGSASFVRLMFDCLEDEHQVYESVAVSVFEAFLRTELTPPESRILLKFAVNVYTGKSTMCGARECAPIAPLLFLRFGDGRTLRRLERSFRSGADTLLPEVLRGVACVLIGSSGGKLEFIRKHASRNQRNVLSEVIRMADEILGYSKITGSRYTDRTKLFFDPLQRRYVIDMRALATLRLLDLNSTNAVRAWVTERLKYFLSKNLSEFDVALLKRLFPKRITDTRTDEPAATATAAQKLMGIAVRESQIQRQSTRPSSAQPTQ